MSVEKQVSVDPAKAVRCQWCGSFESENWRYALFRNHVWCSSSCYSAGHLGEYMCFASSLLVIVVAFFGISMQVQLPPFPYTLYLYLLFYIMTVSMILLSVRSYSDRKKIPRSSL